MSGDHAITLPGVGTARLAAAIHAVVVEEPDRVARLRAGAHDSMTAMPIESQPARRFQTLLEIGYLVASADGFASEERASLARLLESVTGEAINHAALELHFRDLDDAVASLGRRERLARVAADLDDEAAGEEAIGLAALIAMADGALGRAELDALVELGEHIGMSAQRVRGVVDQAVERLEAQLR
jgi:tellurite resistance protein